MYKMQRQQADLAWILFIIIFMVSSTDTFDSDNGNSKPMPMPIPEDYAGFVWPGAIRTISIQGNAFLCKNTCSVCLQNVIPGIIGNLINITYHVRPHIAFTGLLPGFYLISGRCKPSGKPSCRIEPEGMEFEVGDGDSEYMHLGTFGVALEEAEEDGKEISWRRYSSFVLVIIIISLEAIGLLIISEAVQWKMAHDFYSRSDQ